MSVAAISVEHGTCEICGHTETRRPQLMQRDHDHRTGRFRGLLCASCNTRLGWLERDPTWRPTYAGSVQTGAPLAPLAWIEAARAYLARAAKGVPSVAESEGASER